MKITKKHAIGFGLVAGKAAILATLAVSMSGCVVDPSPRGYYRSYPGDYSYDYSQPYYPGTTVVLDADGNEYRGPDRREHVDHDRDHDYDNHWDYGRRGNGNYHGEGDDDVHDR